MMEYVASAVVGGACWRVRGMDFLPNVVGRFAVWGVSVGGMVLACTQSWIYALAAIFLAGAGASFGYFGEFDIALPENRNTQNYLMLTASGMIRMSPMALASVFVGMSAQTFMAVLAGAAFVPCYLVGMRAWPSRFTEVGEVLFGACIYTALAVGLTH